VSFLAHDPETRLSGGGFLAHVHRFHVGVGRSAPAPTHHGADGVFRTLEHRLHPPVVRVADPSRHAEGASPLLTSGTEEHALNPTVDEDTDAAHRDSVP
jgi:hypothetical protein